MNIATYHSICDTLRGLIVGTEWEGHVFAVGGCCRDEVIGRDINDVDLAVNLRDGGVRFAQWLYDNGLSAARPVFFERYGTAMLQLKAFPDYEIEIVQTRKGNYTTDNASDPGSIFGTIEDDGLRRDFTVNSLFFDITKRELIDATGMGLKDIAARKLRTPMSPEMTFYDDPVRILRCIRMASAWNWHIDSATLKAMKEGREGLRDIKPERRRAELEKMLLSPDPVRAMKLVRQVGVMKFLLPELQMTYRAKSKSGGSLWNKVLRTLNSVKGSADIALLYAALLYVLADTKLTAVADKSPKSAKGANAEKAAPNDCAERAIRTAVLSEVILRRLHYHSHFLKDVLFLVRNQYCNHRWGDDGMRAGSRILTRLTRLCVTPQRLARLLQFVEAVNIADSEPDSPLRRQVPNVRKKINKLKIK